MLPTGDRKKGNPSSHFVVLFAVRPWASPASSHFALCSFALWPWRVAPHSFALLRGLRIAPSLCGAFQAESGNKTSDCTISWRSWVINCSLFPNLGLTTYVAVVVSAKAQIQGAAKGSDDPSCSGGSAEKIKKHSLEKEKKQSRRTESMKTQAET